MGAVQDIKGEEFVNNGDFMTTYLWSGEIWKAGIQWVEEAKDSYRLQQQEIEGDKKMKLKKDLWGYFVRI